MNREKIIDEFDRKFFVIPKGAFIDEIKKFLFSKIAEGEREAVVEFDKELYPAPTPDEDSNSDDLLITTIGARKTALARRGIGEGR